MSYRRPSIRHLDACLHALLKRGGSLGLGLGAFTPILALANPSGGQVVAGQATIGTPSANGMVINQASQSAIINWQQFNIGKGQYVQFLQPSSSAVVLNRVVGGSPSSILGTLSANGQVFLVNTNGVFFGKGASIDVQGFLASTIDITDSNFLSGNYVFDHGGAPDAKLVNQGRIRAHNGGYVVLAGDYAENTGIISAQSGHVILAAGSKATLDLNGNKLVHFAIDQATLSNYAGVKNAGSLIADGGTVIMTADVANALKATVVNNTGLIEAKSLTASKGHIYLTATGGNIENAGALTAAADHGGIAGGDIILKGDGRTTLTQASVIDASGQGDKGGHLEVSGDTIKVRGTTTLGKGGDLLLDPGKIQLVGGSGGSSNSHAGTTGTGTATVGVGFIETQLNNGVGVAISAHSAISHATSVTAITATGNANGDLSLKTATGGTIDLSGVDITLAGGFTASIFEGGGQIKLGHLSAKDITLHAVGGLASFAPAQYSSGGGVAVYSAIATGGDLLVDTSVVATAGSSDIALKAANGLTLNAGMGVFYTSPSAHGLVLEGKTVTTNASLYLQGKLRVSAGSGGIHMAGNLGGSSVKLHATGGGISAGLGNSLHGDPFTVTADAGDVKLGQIFSQGHVTVTAATGNVFTGNMQADQGIQITATAGHASVGNLTAASAGITVVTGASAGAGYLSAGGDISLTAGGDIFIHGAGASGALTVNAGAHNFAFGSGTDILGADHGITITAKTLQYSGSGSMQMHALSGDIVVKGLFSDGSGMLHEKLIMNAGGDIKLDHSLKAQHISLSGEGLIYTGKGKTFMLSAESGLSLSASIGAANAAVKYNVLLKDKQDNLSVGRSIYVGHTAGGLAANLTLDQYGDQPSASNNGVYLGGSEAITLSAAGSIALSGWNVRVGGFSSMNAITVKAGKNLTLDAVGNPASLGGGLRVTAVDATATDSKVDHSILLQAGGRLNMTASGIDVGAGAAQANLDNGHASAEAKANVTLKAKGAVTLQATGTGSGIRLHGGDAVAHASISTGAAAGTVTAMADVLITGKSVAVGGHILQLSGGSANGFARAQGSGASVKALAEADVDLKATGDITLTANSIGGFAQLLGRAGAGSQGGAMAGNGNHASATSRSNVGITAGGAISVSGNAVLLSGGSRVGFHSSSHNFASAGGGHAIYTASADVLLSAGSAGITLRGTGSNNRVQIKGGSRLGDDGSALAYGGGIASIAETARVDLITTGDLRLLSGHSVQMSEGSSAGIAAQAQGNNHGAAHFTADAGVGLSGANVTIGSGHTANLNIVGGHLTGMSANALGHSSGSATLDVTAGLTITASKTFTMSGAGLAINAGYRTGRSAIASDFSGGLASIDVDTAVRITAHGTLKMAGDNGLTLLAGNSSGLGRFAVARTQDGTATVHETNGVSLSGASVKLSAVNGDLQIGANNSNAGSRALASGGGTGKADVQLDGGIAITARTGAVTLTTRSFLNVHGANHAGGGTSSHGPSSTTVFPATAAASGQGASAKLEVDAGVNIKAATAIGITQTNASSGQINIAGGARAAGMARAIAISGASATLDADTSVGLKVTGKTGTVTLKGRSLTLHGGIQALAGLPSGTVSSGAVRTPYPISAIGSDAVARVAADAGVNVTAANITLKAGSGAGSLHLSGGNSAGDGMQILAKDGGVAGASAKTGVDLTAASTLTLAGHDILIANFGGSASSAKVSASGDGAKASLDLDRTVHLGAPTLNLLAGFNMQLGIGGSSSHAAGRGAAVHAVGSGSAAIGLEHDIAISATTLHVALTGAGSGGGGISFHGGAEEGRGASVSADQHAKAKLAVSGEIRLTAATLTVDTGVLGGAHISIDGGRGGGSFTSLHAGHGGSATIATDTGVQLNASGMLTVAAKRGNLLVAASGDSAAKFATLTATSDGKAGLTVDTGVALTGAGVTLLAGSASAGAALSIEAGDHKPGIGASLGASYGGSAAVGIHTDVDVSATHGTLSLKAFGVLQVYAGNAASGAASNVQIHAARGGAKAAYALHDAVSLSGTAAVTITATGDMLLTPNNSQDGQHAQASASFGATATFLEDRDLDIATGGAFSAKAGGHLQLLGAQSGGAEGAAQATHAGAQASYLAEDRINITAKSVALTGGSLVRLRGGDDAAVSGAAKADHGGSASYGVDASVNITARDSISVKVNKDAALLQMSGGRSAGLVGYASIGSGGGHAALSGVSDVNLTVTGAGGSITVSAAGHSGAFVALSGGDRAAGGSSLSHAAILALHGGSASLAASARVNLKAKGAITVDAGSGGTLRLEGGSGAGQYALASASNGGTATLTARNGVTLDALTVALHAGQDLSITGGPSNQASHAHGVAHNAGVAGMDLESGVSVKTSGAFTAVADQNMRITANPGSHAGTNMTLYANGSGAQALLTESSAVNITAGTVALTAGNLLFIAGGDDAGRNVGLSAASSSAQVNYAVDASTNLTAKGAFSITAGNGLTVNGGDALMSGGFFSAAGTGAAVTATAKSGVALTAGGSFTATVFNLTLGAGTAAGSSVNGRALHRGASVNLTEDSGVALSALSVKVVATGDIGIAGGDSAGRFASTSVDDNGTMAQHLTSRVDITAVKGISVVQSGGGLSVRAGNNVAHHAHITGTAGGSTELTADASVRFTAGGAIKFSGAGHSTLSAGHFAISSAAPIAGTGGGGIAAMDLASSLVFTGTSVKVSGAAPTGFSSGTASSGGVVTKSLIETVILPASITSTSQPLGLLHDSALVMHLVTALAPAEQPRHQAPQSADK